MNKIAAKKNLEDATRILNDAGVRWTLVCGTALGCVREGDFLDHDTDIDLGVFPVNQAKMDEIITGFMNAGFDRYAIDYYGTIENGYEISFVRDDVKVDIFFLYREGDKVWLSVWKNSGLEQLFYDHSAALFDELREVWFQEMKCYVPNPVEQYLTEQYGDWQTVVKQWSWHKDPKSLRKGDK